jgi:hypothetical protein
MAHLGTITDIHVPRSVTRPFPLTPISDYDVVRGKFLGEIVAVDNRPPTPTLIGPLTGYVVRQIRVLYRQLWPSHGQRFPQ